MSHNDRHLTTEQLSDFIDNRITVAERSQVEDHLQCCARCQEELTNLRQVVMMIHALPRPALSRSFALPADTKATLPTSITASGRVERTAVVPRRVSALRTTTRGISTLAAVLGLALLLSGLPGLLGGHGGATPTSGSANSASSPPGSQLSPRHIQPLVPDMSTGATATSHQGQPHIIPPSGHIVTPSPQIPPVLDLSQPLGRVVLGGILLAIGLVGALILWRRRYSLP